MGSAKKIENPLSLEQTMEDSMMVVVNEERGN